jgi:hypothetical protein
MSRFYCKCGTYYGIRRNLLQHIAICNPHWPRKSEQDQHEQITEEQWQQWKAKQYAILRGEEKQGIRNPELWRSNPVEDPE